MRKEKAIVIQWALCGEAEKKCTNCVAGKGVKKVKERSWRWAGEREMIKCDPGSVVIVDIILLWLSK